MSSAENFGKNFEQKSMQYEELSQVSSPHSQQHLFQEEEEGTMMPITHSLTEESLKRRVTTLFSSRGVTFDIDMPLHEEAKQPTLPMPFCEEDYEWDQTLPSWQNVKEQELIDAVSGQGFPLEMLIKTREGRKRMRDTLRGVAQCQQSQIVVDGMRVALNEHQKMKTLKCALARKEKQRLKKEEALFEREAKRERREIERLAKAEIKKEKQEVRLRARQEKKAEKESVKATKKLERERIAADKRRKKEAATRQKRAAEFKKRRLALTGRSSDSDSESDEDSDSDSD
jgi:hypothetical protein